MSSLGGTIGFSSGREEKAAGPAKHGRGARRLSAFGEPPFARSPCMGTTLRLVGCVGPVVYWKHFLRCRPAVPGSGNSPQTEHDRLGDSRLGPVEDLVVPKQKSHRGAKKRFKLTGSGKVKRGHSMKNHILTKKDSKRKRHLRKGTLVSPAMAKAIKAMIA